MPRFHFTAPLPPFLPAFFPCSHLHVTGPSSINSDPDPLRLDTLTRIEEIVPDLRVRDSGLMQRERKAAGFEDGREREVEFAICQAK